MAVEICLATGLLAGCANQLRELEQVEQHTRSEPLSSRVLIEGVEDPLRQPLPVLALVRIDATRERTERLVVKQIEVTPYTGWRELYEVPAGAASVPLTLVLNALNAVLVGYVPDEQVRAFTRWTYAALNPALNAESKRRVEQRRGAVVSSAVDEVTREVRSPLAGAQASVRIDGGPPSELRSDARGLLALHLLEIADPGHELRPRKLVVEIATADGSGTATREFLIERDLAQRLRQARSALAALQSRRDEPRALARAIYELDRLGFEAYSLGVEDDIAVQLHRRPAQLAAFSRELDRLYGAPPADMPSVGKEPLP